MQYLRKFQVVAFYHRNKLPIFPGFPNILESSNTSSLQDVTRFSESSAWDKSLNDVLQFLMRLYFLWSWRLWNSPIIPKSFMQLYFNIFSESHDDVGIRSFSPYGTYLVCTLILSTCIFNARLNIYCWYLSEGVCKCVLRVATGYSVSVFTCLVFLSEW